MSLSADNPQTARALRIVVRGIVQGVGFRPFVYNLATGMGLMGSVANTSGGVEIEIEGPALNLFLQRLRDEAPPLASIDDIQYRAIEPTAHAGFSIITSRSTGSFTLVSPDVALCADCLREMRNPADRRYRYPFITCTNCGPRYTITESTPYDRPNTTMRRFTMCPACQSEYDDPTDRRFHAVPNACAQCGPSLRLVNHDGSPVACTDVIIATAEALLSGRIVAMRSLGGFHLACLASSVEAVTLLRARKRRPSKPFALMAQRAEDIRPHAALSEREEAMLCSARRPVVLLQRQPGSTLPAILAPGNTRLGFMLPYTPLHHLLFDALPQGTVLVMTSGNRSEEPIEVDNDSALSSLSTLADIFVLHNRDIFMRVDDSVLLMHPALGRPTFLRRARGYAPDPLPLHASGPDVLAVGADLKNTFTLLKERFAITSQHTGDLQNADTLAFFEETLRNLMSVYRVSPVAVAHDMHPDYHSTLLALSLPADLKIPVQHHHAHVASVMAERGLTGPVVGVALDGTGYGPDGSIWGGEFLLATAKQFERAAHFAYLPLPGGEQAVRHPWRTAVSLIDAAYGADSPEILRRIGFHDRYGEQMVEQVLRISRQAELSPASSSAGRLFEAVAALLALCDENTFEAEAAIALECAADPGEEGEYMYDIRSGNTMIVDFSWSVIRIINDLSAGVPASVISARVHNTVAAAVATVVEVICVQNNITTVVLSGGVFQNMRLLGSVMDRLMQMKFTVYTNELLPPNDACVSLGQAYIVRHSGVPDAQ